MPDIVKQALVLSTVSILCDNSAWVWCFSCYVLYVTSDKHVVVNDGSEEHDSTDRFMVDDLLKSHNS
jgi:hypothetical protein